MTIVGMLLSSYTETLVPVDERFNAPRGEDNAAWSSFDIWEAIGPHARRYAEQRFVYPEGSPLPAFAKVATSMPLRALNRLSFDQLCKVHFSSMFMLDSSVRDLFEKESSDPAHSPEHRLVAKIESSMWRWGHGRSSWNDLVIARQNILSFSLGLDDPDFEIRLDHSTYVNECGYSEYSRTYLDGALAYLVYYKGRHVMTLGFSVMDGRRVLIQQIQLANRRGNRFLFRLPANRVEWVIERFQAAFPGHDLFMVDGRAVAQKSLRSYESAYERSSDRLRRAQERMLRGVEESSREWVESDIKTSQEEIELFAEKVAHLSEEVGRIEAFYAATGRYRRGEPLKVNSLTHYALAA